MSKHYAFGRIFDVEDGKCRKCGAPINKSHIEDQDTLCDLCFKKMLRKEDMNYDHLRDMEYQQRERYSAEQEQEHWDKQGGVL